MVPTEDTGFVIIAHPGPLPPRGGRGQEEGSKAGARRCVSQCRAHGDRAEPGGDQDPDCPPRPGPVGLASHLSGGARNPNVRFGLDV